MKISLTSVPLALALALGLVSPTAQSQMAAMPIPIATQPGTYNFNNQAKVEVKALDFSKLLQQQDRDAYNRASQEAYNAFTDLYGACNGTSYHQCTGFQKLRQIYTQTTVTHALNMVPSTDLADAINSFSTKRDLFIQKLAGMETLSEVWKGIGDGANTATAPETRLIYQQGSINLHVVGDSYRKAINDLVQQASKFTYSYDSGLGVAATTQPGMGLELPATNQNLNTLKQTLEAMRAQLKFSNEEVTKLKIMHFAVAQQLVNFIGTNGMHLVWYTNSQSQDMKDWIESVQNKARIQKWIRAYFCMPIGVPAADIAEPAKFNLGFLNRGVNGQFQLRQAVEFDEGNIRKMLSRLDLALTSAASQAGDFNNSGGIMSYVNRVNSTFTWHNEVAAGLNVMRLLREGMMDELDLLSGSELGCAKVRNRYYAKYNSLLDESFKPVLKRYLEGVVVGGGNDYMLRAFNDAGAVMLPHGKIYQDLMKFQKQHPETSLVESLFKQAPDKDDNGDIH